MGHDWPDSRRRCHDLAVSADYAWGDHELLERKSSGSSLERIRHSDASPCTCLLDWDLSGADFPPSQSAGTGNCGTLQSHVLRAPKRNRTAIASPAGTHCDRIRKKH